jgi:hypothetical protein
LGKYIPQLVEIFLRKYFQAGQTILDPFAGSGTTLVQANELGMHSIGYDVSAFNVLLMRAKTAKYNVDLVRREVDSILAQLEPFADDLFAKRIDVSSHPLAANSYLRSWYSPSALAELLRFRELIPQYKNQDLLKVILCRAARSARMARHFDLDFPRIPQTEPYYCHKHRRTCPPTSDALKFLRRYAVDTVRRVAEFSKLRTEASITIGHGDSRSAKFPQIDGVITSPPYVGLIDYHEQHIYAYHLLGLEDRRKSEIGPASSGSGKTAKRRYQEEIAEVFANAAAALKRGGRIIVVVGDRANLYDEIRQLAGLKLENVIQRHVNRRTGRRSSEFYESVLVWKR